MVSRAGNRAATILSSLGSISIVMQTSRFDYFRFDSDTQSFLKDLISQRFQKHEVRLENEVHMKP